MHASTVAQTVTSPPIPATEGLVNVEGIVYERVHPSTRQIIHTLFPPHTRGETFFLGLLEHATIKPDVLRYKPKEMRGDVAVVSVLGCAELSQLVHLSYDTTQKYLAIYRALGLLDIEKQGKLTTITIPLTVHLSPGELAKRLRQLRECYLHKRPKLLSLIDNMIDRTPSLAQEDEERLPFAEQGHTLPNAIELLVPIQQVLVSEGVEDLNGHIAKRILEVFARATMASNGKDFQIARRFSNVNLPSRQENVSEVDSAAGESTLCTVPASCPERFDVGNLPTRYPGGDSELIAASDASQGSTKCSRFLEPNLPFDQQTSEEMEPGSAEDGRFAMGKLTTIQQTARASHKALEPARLNLPIRADSNPLKIKNGIGNGMKNNSKNTNYKSDPDPDQQTSQSVIEKRIPDISLPIAHPSIRHQALALAKLIEGTERNVGAFVELLRKYDQQAIKAGAIATLHRRYFPGGRKALRAPGGYFTQQVQQFQEALPEQIVDLLETYAQASYEEIEAALEKQAQAQAVHQRPEVFGPSQAESRSRRGQPMNEGMATKLAGRIASENPNGQIKGICKTQDGTYAVKVYIDPVEYDFCSIEEWETYHAQMQALELEVSR